MTKKVIAIVSLFVLLLGGAFILWLNAGRTVPEPKAEKVVLSKYSGSTMGSISLERFVADAMIAVQGQIIETELIYRPFLTGTPIDEKIANMSDGKTPEIAFTKYTIEVKQQFLGGKVEDTIECIMPGAFDREMTKPKGNEEVFLFVSLNGARDYYMPVAAEHSLYTVDEKGRLYSYSDREHFEKYDGQPVSALAKEIDRLEKYFAKYDGQPIEVLMEEVRRIEGERQAEERAKWEAEQARLGAKAQ